MEIPLVDLKKQNEMVGERLRTAIHEVIESSSFIKGKVLSEFENKFAKYCGLRYGVGTSSGTTALHLALLAAGIGKGDEVITVPNSFISTASTICHSGADVQFVDVNEDDNCIDVSKIKINKNTKCILPVHLYGHPANMNEVIKVAKENDLLIIEDCAQAHGSEFSGKRVPITDIGIFSFFPAKNLGAFGDAGMVVTNNKEIADKVEKLRDHGRSVGTKYEHDILGFNFRLDTIQAAVLNEKIKFLDRWNEMRRKNANIYNELLDDLVETPKEKKYAKHVYYTYVIRAKERDKLAAYLKSKGVATQIYFPIPLHLQKAFSHLSYKKGDFPVTERYAKEILSLPMFPGLSIDQINHVCKCIKEFYK